MGGVKKTPWDTVPYRRGKNRCKGCGYFLDEGYDNCRDRKHIKMFDKQYAEYLERSCEEERIYKIWLKEVHSTDQYKRELATLMATI